MAKFRSNGIRKYDNLEDVSSDMYQLKQQLEYVFNHIEKDNLTAQTYSDLSDKSANKISGILKVPSGGTGRDSLTENQLLYGAGAEAPASLGFPSVAGSVLSQDIIGAPYWGPPNYNRCFAEVMIGETQVIATTTRTKLNFNAAGYVVDNYDLFTIDSTGLKVNKTGYYSLYYYVDLGAITGWGSGGLLWIGTSTNQQAFHRRLDGGNNADYADNLLIYMVAEEYVYVGISQGSATSNSYGANRRDAARIVLRPISL